MLYSAPASGRPKTDWIHYILIVFGFLLLFQDLVSENTLHLGIINQVVKFMDDTIPYLLLGMLSLSRLVSRKNLVRTNLDSWLLFFLIFAIASSLLQRVPVSIFMSQLIIYLKGFACFYIFANLSLNEAVIHKYSRFFLLSGIFFLFFGLIDLIIPYEFRSITGNTTYIQYYKGLPSVKSFFVHPAFFGWYMSFTAAFCFSFFLVMRKKRALFAGLLFLFGAFLSMRLKSILGFCSALLLGALILPSPRRLSKTIFLFILMALGFLLFWPFFWDMLYSKTMMYINQTDPLDAARIALYLKGIEIARDYFPLGAGLGRYGSWLSRVYYSPLYEAYELSAVYGMSPDLPGFINDTFWPMVMGETGLAGIVAYMGLLLKALHSLYRKVRSSLNRNYRVFYLAGLIIIIESLVESLAKPVYTRSPDTLFIFGILGICYALSRSEQKIAHNILANGAIFHNHNGLREQI